MAGPLSFLGGAEGTRLPALSLPKGGVLNFIDRVARRPGGSHPCPKCMPVFAFSFAVALLKLKASST